MAIKNRTRIKKSSTSKKTDFMVEPMSLDNQTNKNSQRKLLQRPSFILLLIVVFFIFGSLIYKNKKFFIVGIVNNRPITSIELYSKLASQGGKQMFDQIVVEALIVDAAKKKNINVSETDIDNEITKIEKNLGENTNLTDALTQQGMTLKDLRAQVKMRLTAIKLVEGNVSVTDEEVNKYITDNKDFLPKEEDEQKQKESVKEILIEQKINTQIQTLLQELKSSAKITSFL